MTMGMAMELKGAALDAIGHGADLSAAVGKSLGGNAGRYVFWAALSLVVVVLLVVVAKLLPYRWPDRARGASAVSLRSA